jgi:hypothetical protein
MSVEVKVCVEVGRNQETGGTMSDNDGVNLQSEDRARMQRLSEEVRGRLEEMALITTRTLGVDKKDGARVQFLPVQLRPDESGNGTVLQVLSPADEGFECVCYKDPPGICFPCDGEEVVIFD